MIESRCGILCDECQYRGLVSCNGCMNIKNPFWGESCPIKACCEEKQHKFCGQCGAFPCELLKKFAYDKDQGDNGKRIEQSRRWLVD